MAELKRGLIMDKVTLLWTGGWDSTFRFLQLAEQPVIIQPIYLIHKGRVGKEYEKKAMSEILKAVKSGEFKLQAKILDFQYYDVDWVLKECADAEITEAFKYLRAKYNIGAQYEWFALLTKYLGVKMEIGIEILFQHTGTQDAIATEGTLSLMPNDILPERYQVLPRGENRNAFLVFGNLILPLIKLIKKDMERIAAEKGWLEIMKLTWFCHSPINGEPCGLCNPCNDAMHNGMEWRLPPKARWRNRHRKFYLFLRRVRRHIPFFVK